MSIVTAHSETTDRKEAKQEAQSSDERLLACLDHAPTAIAVLDRGMQYVYANRRWRSHFTSGSQDIVGRSHYEVFPYVPDRWQDIHRRALAGEVVSGDEDRFDGRDGTAHWLRWEVRPWHMAAGEPGGVILYIEDLTARKQAEAEREQISATLDSLVASAPVGIVVFDTDMRYRHINGPLAEMNGVPAEAHIGRTVAEIVPDLHEPAETLFREVMNGGVAVPNFLIEGETPKAPGIKRCWRESWFPIKAPDGKPSGVGAIVQEITHERLLERERENSQRTLATLVESCPFGIYLVDADFRIASVNAGSQQSTFANVRPLIGRPFEEVMRILWPEPIAADCIAIFRRTLDTGEPYRSADFLSNRADVDQTEGYEWEIHRITLPDGRYGVVCYYFNSTRLRLAEQALKETDRKKDEFLATLAHELRNPLAPIRNGLHVIKLAGNDAAAVEQARSMMERQLEQMVRLVDDLMDVSRISRGRIELRRQRVQLAAVVGSAVEASRPLIEQMRHKLTITLPKDPVIVDADSTRLAQVFMNLLNNAAKYSDRPGHIQLDATRQGSEVVVSVKDTGIGVDAGQLPTLFDLFSQVDRASERSQGGLGIGLHLVKKLVELHGGLVEACSEGLGKGSKFVVRLPIAVGEQHVRQNSVDTIKAAGSTRLRILVVDDNKDAASSLAMMLELMGNDVRTAHDGSEAIEAAAEFLPYVVLLDIGLPKVNGYEVCRQIKQQAWGKHMVVIAVTGWGQTDAKQQSEQAGFDLHMVKPVDPQALKELLSAATPTLAPGARDPERSRATS